MLPFVSARENFGTPEEAAPTWQVLDAGVGYFHASITKPQLEFWAVRIDRASAYTGIVVKGGQAVSEGRRTLSAKVSSFVRDNDLIAGINAVPFDVSTAEEGQAITNIGIVICGGELIAPANLRYDALVFYRDGRAEITRQAAIHSIEDIENAVGGFYQILSSGEPAPRTLDRMARHPRSAAGLSADGEYLYLLVIDGRRAGSVGATEKETALLLKALGSVDGINFDGGGSSALVLRTPDGTVRVANTPVHNGIAGMERAVAGCLGVSRSFSPE